MDVVIALVLVAVEVAFMGWLVGRPRHRSGPNLAADAYRLGLRARYR